MKLTVNTTTPFGAHICQYLYDMDSNFAKEDRSQSLTDIVAHILYATARIRMGNENISDVANKKISQFIANNTPIFIGCIFGDEESDKETIDISELQALQTLKDINERVKEFYYPGLTIRLQVVGKTSYVDNVTKLATILGGFTFGSHNDTAVSVSFAHYRAADFYYKSIPSRNVLRGGWIPAWSGRGYLSIESPHEITSMMTNSPSSDLISTAVTIEDKDVSVDLRIDYLM